MKACRNGYLKCGISVNNRPRGHRETALDTRSSTGPIDTYQPGFRQRVREFGGFMTKAAVASLGFATGAVTTACIVGPPVMTAMMYSDSVSAIVLGAAAIGGVLGAGLALSLGDLY